MTRFEAIGCGVVLCVALGHGIYHQALKPWLQAEDQAKPEKVAAPAAAPKTGVVEEEKAPDAGTTTLRDILAARTGPYYDRIDAKYQAPNCPDVDAESCSCFFARVATPQGRKRWMGNENAFPCDGADDYKGSRCCKPGGGRR